MLKYCVGLASISITRILVTRDDINDYLNSLRKTESIDPTDRKKLLEEYSLEVEVDGNIINVRNRLPNSGNSLTHKRNQQDDLEAVF